MGGRIRRELWERWFAANCSFRRPAEQQGQTIDRIEKSDHAAADGKQPGTETENGECRGLGDLVGADVVVKDGGGGLVAESGAVIDENATVAAGVGGINRVDGGNRIDEVVEVEELGRERGAVATEGEAVVGVGVQIETTVSDEDGRYFIHSPVDVKVAVGIEDEVVAVGGAEAEIAGAGKEAHGHAGFGFVPVSDVGLHVESGVGRVEPDAAGAAGAERAGIRRRWGFDFIYFPRQLFTGLTA
jgi:hypothetical protein